ncbi:DUF2061 domain-containing protein [Patescibacteria group bacterium]|nr:DUF2061 domain-containing protein [Patescibacteria group bacterium]
METRLRSAEKSVVWRACGIIILAAITWMFTRDWMQVGLVTVIHHGVFLVVFYIHERVWLRFPVENMLTQSVLKMFTYETLCGNIILGTITYLITGSFTKMTAITLTYIGFKHVCYIINEFVWRRGSL